MKKLTIALCGMTLCSIHASAHEKGVEVCRKPYIPIEVVEPIVDGEKQPETEAIPQKYAGEKEVAIKLEKLEPVGERVVMRAVFRIINPTDKPISFTGYSVTSPITMEQHFKDGKWEPQKKVLRCGTGLRQCTIPPGQAAVFFAQVYPQNMPLRVGLKYAQGDKEVKQHVWSEKIES